MANIAPNITAELKHTLEASPNIAVVYFTQDGLHHFRAFDFEKGKYTRLRDVPEKSKAGVYTGKHVKDRIYGVDGKTPDPRYAVAKEMPREAVLSAKLSGRAATPALIKSDALGVLDISEEELAAVLAARAKGNK